MKVAIYRHADGITGDDSFSFDPVAEPADTSLDLRSAGPSPENASQSVKVPNGSTFVLEQSGKKLLAPNGRTYGANSVWFLAKIGAEGFSF